MRRITFGSFVLLFIILSFSHLPSRSQGLHGYIASYPSQAPSAYGEGYGFYSAIWPLIAEPVHHFQIGLPSTWIIPDNSDNTTIPLCPVGTVARDNWPERGPTYSSVFQTVEGGPGYWAGNKFHYGPPKFKLNSTPNCYSQEISNPGWQFFWSDSPLPDDVLGVAQISNRILVPPDGMTFEGNPNGELLGISYMALPLTNAYSDEYPVGERSWTLFLNAENFKGPLAYYVPETWAKISKDYPFDYGRGLDARPSTRNLSGGTMEFNTVPVLSALDSKRDRYYKIPRLQFPVDSLNRSILSKDVTFYSKVALYNDVLEWRQGGDIPSGSFQRRGSFTPTMRTNPVNYNQGGKTVVGINELATPAIFYGNEFGLKWSGNITEEMGSFPEYYKDSLDFRVAVPNSLVPPSTGLIDAKFNKPNPNPTPYRANLEGSWRTPGPAAGPFYAYLDDHSMVTYFWYRFIDQPVFQQFNWSESKKDSLQNLIEQMHEKWSIEQNYMKEPSSGNLVSFDDALFVTPPAEYSIGYVPIVVGQEKSDMSRVSDIEETKSPIVEMYPNPASEFVTIVLNSKQKADAKLELLDLNGRVLKTIIIDRMQKEIDISWLPNGFYILSYAEGNRFEKLRLIKTN